MAYPCKLTQSERAEAQKMYMSGISTYEIGATFGVSQMTAWKAIKDCNRTKKRIETAEYLRSLGFSNAQIAERIGICQQHVRNLIGNQPEEMTKKNRMSGMEVSKIRQEARRANHMIELQKQSNKIVLEYNAHKAKLEALRLQLEALEAEDKAMRREAKKALKHATVEIA